eukprot:GHVR01080489.1.p1 GENE.GHVR01080489.1~~GHVR01080489.1.p1  ORF type:complete len:342 (+),score=59.01 GHVR01080489.1:65-1090(+)
MFLHSVFFAFCFSSAIAGRIFVKEVDSDLQTKEKEVELPNKYVIPNPTPEVGEFHPNLEFSVSHNDPGYQIRLARGWNKFDFIQNSNVEDVTERLAPTKVEPVEMTSTGDKFHTLIKFHPSTDNKNNKICYHTYTVGRKQENLNYSGCYKLPAGLNDKTVESATYDVTHGDTDVSSSQSQNKDKSVTKSDDASEIKHETVATPSTNKPTEELTISSSISPAFSNENASCGLYMAVFDGDKFDAVVSSLIFSQDDKTQHYRDVIGAFPQEYPGGEFRVRDRTPSLINNAIKGFEVIIFGLDKFSFTDEFTVSMRWSATSNLKLLSLFCGRDISLTDITYTDE